MNHDCITDHQGRAPCTCGQLHTANSDGTSPEAERRDFIELAIDTALFLFVIGCGAMALLVMSGYFKFA